MNHFRGSTPRQCGFGGSVLLLGAGVAVSLWHWKKSRELRAKAIEKHENEQAHISSQSDNLNLEIDPAKAEEILGLSAKDLLKSMQDRKLEPIDVLKAYLWKTFKVTRQFNCATSIVKDCHKTAENLGDKNCKEFSLYGMPVSLKESFQTKGIASTAGCAKFIDNIAKEDCVLAKVLRHCGAVPFVKTNIPQTMLSFESSNPIYGETSNPHNPNFAPGGSSAGEGCIIGGGASPLGFGTDIAGSIRVPSHFSGICGLKPTKNRLSSIGLMSSLPGQSAVAATLGPMARDVDTLVIAMRALLCDRMFQLDPAVPPIQFRNEIFQCKEPLRIGYYEDDSYMSPVPACKRAVRMTKEALEKAGHVLIPYKIPDIEKLMDLTSQAFYADGGETCMGNMKNDVVDQRFRHCWRRWRMPPGFRRLYYHFLNFKSPRIAKDVMAYGGGDKSVARLWNIAAQMAVYKAKFWDEWREKYKIDALICPVYPMVACPKGKVDSMTAWMSYTVPYNVVDCPAGVVTITKVSEKDIHGLDSYKGHYDDAWDHHVKEATKDSINMPVGVQCVAPPWQEERCLRLMKEVENLLVKS